MKTKLETARDAINAVFGDTSVSREETKRQLEELAADIDMNLQTMADGEDDRAQEEDD